MSDEDVDLQCLARQSQRTLEEMRQLRKDFNEMMRLVVSGHDLTRRVERRQTELRDDLELMIKMELGGALANVQTSIEHSLRRMEHSIEEVTDRVGALERRP